MRYIVPNMKLIPQQKTMSCWYACAQMLIQWKRESLHMSLMGHPDPENVPELVRWRTQDNGITNKKIIELARVLGLEAVPPMSPTIEYMGQLMMRYGPLWTNGVRHIVVIAGINQVRGNFLVYDPMPVGKGTIEWRPISWYYGKSAGAVFTKSQTWNYRNSTRDVDNSVQIVLLYHP